jgi:hypothetical protein
MGHIDRFDLNKYIREYQTTIFVETGTGVGDSLRHAFNFSFDEFYTIEIIKELFEKTKEELKFKNNCHFLNSDSEKGLSDILSNISSDKNICFWLDAHFPGADFGLTTYDSTDNGNIRIPLESELKVISLNRDVKNDVFIIDDLRIYEDGPFGDGNWSRRKELGGENIYFIYELFDKTHHINRDYRDQGYIVLTPKK